jgi:N-acetylglucosamine-6-phosphate deacetylase
VSERSGRLLLGGELVPGVVRFQDGRILAVDAAGRPQGTDSLPIVAPGLIDLHVHGYGGGEPLESLDRMRLALAAQGTTAFLATLFPADPALLGRQAAALERVASAGGGPGARVLGVHLEGPFVNPAAAGALPREAIAEPTPAALRAILGPASGDGRGIRTMTLAPELPGGLDLVRELGHSGVRVSLGHSLATAEDARRAARAGASGVTHLYNAMRGLHHREAGLAGFALAADALTAEIIGDLVHVGREAFALALRARGPGGIALVSDALAASGTGCEVFHSHGKRCLLKDGAIWFEDPAVPGGLRLTGAAASQMEAVRRLVQAGVVSLAEALTMGSATPAAALGLERELGVLAPGARADLIVLHGDDLALAEVLVGGEPVELAPAPAGERR